MKHIIFLLAALCGLARAQSPVAGDIKIPQWTSPTANVYRTLNGVADAGKALRFNPSTGVLETFSLSGYAPLASPAFTGTVAAPVVTTIPAGSRAVFDGDSITRGQGASAGEDWPSVLVTLPSFTGRVTKFNYGSDGAKIATLAARYTASVYPNRPAATGVPCNLFISVGSNNIRDGDTAVDTVAALKAYCDTARADGFIVWVGTVMDRADYTYLTRFQQSEYNRLIRDGTFWDKLVDFALIGSDSGDTTIFSDYAHPNAQGYAMMARFVNRLAQQSTSPVVDSSSAQNLSRIMAGRGQFTSSIVIGQDTPISGSVLSLGPTNGTRKLCVYDDGTFHFGMGCAPMQLVINTGTDESRSSFVTNAGAEVMTVKNTGRLGIGNANPAAALDVTGGGIFTSGVSAPTVTARVVAPTVAPTIASASTIAPTAPITFISGTVTIQTITAPTGTSSTGGQITLIPTGLWSTNTSGNIALATTGVVSKALILFYDATTGKWYPSY